MHIDTKNLEKPIFLQIAEQIEDSIFTGVYGEEERIPSTNEIAALLNINPHTVLKGVNLLVEEDILYKKRGLGMFVKEGAREKIRNKRKNAFFEQYIERLIQEAGKLQMTKEQVIELIERGYAHDSLT
ncbi:MAG: GntR family transcriptional regulator [Hydrogeniiclostridium sp.]